MMKDTIKTNDVVRIRPEWCDGESDRLSLWVVFEIYDNTNRCKAGKIMNKEEMRDHPLGFVQLFDLAMVEKVEV